MPKIDDDHARFFSIIRFIDIDIGIRRNNRMVISAAASSVCNRNR